MLKSHLRVAFFMKKNELSRQKLKAFKTTYCFHFYVNMGTKVKVVTLFVYNYVCGLFAVKGSNPWDLVRSEF